MRWDLEIQVLHLINVERTVVGLPAVMPHVALRHAARNHALDMLAHGYLSHLSRDGRTPVQRALLAGARVQAVTENLGYATDVRAAHVAFMSSEVHRGRILSRGARLVGIGVADGGQGGVLVVEDFGR